MKSSFLSVVAAGLFTILAAVAVFPRPASALITQGLVCGTNTVTFSFPRGVRGPAGTITKLAELTVPTNLQGSSAQVNAETTNNTSVHPNTDIIILSSTTSFTLSDVEGAANKVTTASGVLALGSTVDLTVKFGPAGVFSGDGDVKVVVNCPPTSQTLVCGTNTVTFSFPRGVRGPAGTTTKLAELTVPTNLQGSSAQVNAETTNNTSVHPDTQLIIASGSTNFTLDDIEGAANKVTTGQGQLTLGSVVDVSVKLGPDGIFSGGSALTVTVNCPGGRGGDTPDKPQVKVIPASVNAGSGGAKETNPIAVVGLVGSLTALGFGLRRFGKHLL